MLEVIGALFITGVALALIFYMVATPLMGLAWGGPTLVNWTFMLVGLALSAGVALGWWHLVGTNINVGLDIE